MNNKQNSKQKDFFSKLSSKFLSEKERSILLNHWKGEMQTHTLKLSKLKENELKSLGNESNDLNGQIVNSLLDKTHLYPYSTSSNHKNLNSVPELHLGCTSHLLTVPYQTASGYPLIEEIGESTQIVCKNPPNSSDEFFSFSELSIPYTGQLSLGTSLGKFGECFNYKPRRIFNIGPVVVLSTNCFTNFILPYIPQEKLTKGNEVEFSIDLTIGNPDIPFYAIVPPVGDGHNDHLKQSAFRLEAELFFFQTGSFLEELSNDHIFKKTIFSDRVGTSGTSILYEGFDFDRKFNLTRRFKVTNESTIIAVGIQIGLYSSLRRVINPSSEITGFVAVDLRENDNETHSIHPDLNPGGPIYINSIKVNICNPQVFAPILS